MSQILDEKFTGKYHGMDTSKLEPIYLEQRRILKLFGMIEPFGSGPPLFDEAPLWLLVEFQEKVIQFELACNPKLAEKIAQ